TFIERLLAEGKSLSWVGGSESAFTLTILQLPHTEKLAHPSFCRTSTEVVKSRLASRCCASPATLRTTAGLAWRRRRKRARYQTTPSKVSKHAASAIGFGACSVLGDSAAVYRAEN